MVSTVRWSCIGRDGQTTTFRLTYEDLLVTQASSLIPGVALRLEETVPSGQDLAFDRGEIDIGFTRPPSADRSSSYESRLLFREPLVVPFPKTRKVKAKRIRIADL